MIARARWTQFSAIAHALWVNRGSKEKASWKVLGVKHKKVEQALRRSLRNLFEQLAGVLRQLRYVMDPS